MTGTVFFWCQFSLCLAYKVREPLGVRRVLRADPFSYRGLFGFLEDPLSQDLLPLVPLIQIMSPLLTFWVFLTVLSTHTYFVRVSWLFQIPVLGEKNPITVSPDQFFLPLWSLTNCARTGCSQHCHFTLLHCQKSNSDTILNLVLALSLVTHILLGSRAMFSGLHEVLRLFPVGVRV